MGENTDKTKSININVTYWKDNVWIRMYNKIFKYKEYNTLTETLDTPMHTEQRFNFNIIFPKQIPLPHNVKRTKAPINSLDKYKLNIPQNVKYNKDKHIYVKADIRLKIGFDFIGEEYDESKTEILLENIREEEYIVKLDKKEHKEDDVRYMDTSEAYTQVVDETEESAHVRKLHTEDNSNVYLFVLNNVCLYKTDVIDFEYEEKHKDDRYILSTSRVCTVDS